MIVFVDSWKEWERAGGEKLKAEIIHTLSDVYH